MKKRAEFEAILSGGPQFANEAGKMAGSLEKVSKAVASGVGGALSSVGGALANVVQGGLTAAGVFQNLSLASAVEDAKRLDAATAKLGVTAGVSGSVLKSNFNDLEKRTLASSLAMADFAKSLGRATYDSKFAAESVAALGDDALSMGRDLGDELPLAAALRDMGVTSSGVAAELGRLRDMAERVGTIGGPAALKDTMAALQPLLAGVATESDEARARLEALIATLGKGLKPQQAQAVGSAALSTIRGRAMDIERLVGRNVIDDKGQIIDPARIIGELKAQADRRFGKNDAAKRRALMSDFGQDLGLAILRYNPAEAEQLAKQAGDTGKTSREAEAFRQSTGGKRLGAELAKGQAMRTAGEKLLGVHDAIIDRLGVPGGIAAELVGGQVAASGAKALAGKGLAAAGGSAAAAAALPLALMGGIAYAGYRDNEAQRPYYEAERQRQKDEAATAQGLGLPTSTFQDMQRRGLLDASGGLGDAAQKFIGTNDGKPPVVVLQEGSAKVLGDALADALRRSPIQVKQPQTDPNARAQQ